MRILSLGGSFDQCPQDKRQIIVRAIDDSWRAKEIYQLLLRMGSVGHPFNELEERCKERRVRAAFRHLKSQHLETVREYGKARSFHTLKANLRGRQCVVGSQKRGLIYVAVAIG